MKKRDNVRESEGEGGYISKSPTLALLTCTIKGDDKMVDKIKQGATLHLEQCSTLNTSKRVIKSLHWIEATPGGGGEFYSVRFVGHKAGRIFWAGH